MFGVPKTLYTFSVAMFETRETESAHFFRTDIAASPTQVVVPAFRGRLGSPDTEEDWLLHVVSKNGGSPMAGWLTINGTS